MNNFIRSPQSSYIKGRIAEEIAMRYLCNQGVEIVAHNTHYPFGEIDVIGKFEGVLIAFEVRYRSNATFISPIETITKSKVKRILNCLVTYAKENSAYKNFNLRIDIICITGTLHNPTITWIPNII
ncbi:MAG: YraN family protein [Methylacidiphilales bacterium]|nr:YraN family protein [Candidatus Methylacidiphilales bacterium]